MTKEELDRLASNLAERIVKDLQFVAPEMRNEWLKAKIHSAIVRGADMALNQG